MNDLSLKTTPGFLVVKDVALQKKFDRILQFEYKDFCNFETFSGELMSKLNENNIYSILSRIGYIPDLDNKSGNKRSKHKDFIDINKYKQSNTDWKMLGKQTGIKVDSYQELEKEVSNIYNKICDILEESMDYYHYTGSDVVVIQILIYCVGIKTPKRIKQFSVKSLGEHKDLVNISKISEGFSKYIPLLYIEKDFGVLLTKEIRDNSILNIVLQDGIILNIVNSINKYLITEQIKSISSNVNFYQKKVGSNDILVCVEIIDNKTVFKIYTLTGMLLQTIIDEKISGNNYIRHVGNVKGFINKRGLYKKAISTKFTPIQPFKLKGKSARMIQPDWRLGTLDLEAYTYGEQNKAYAIGFYTKDSVKTFYIDSDLNSDNLIINCINEMLTEKYNGYNFYVHNWTNYDVYFIFRVIVKLSELHPYIYKYKPYYRDGDIIGLDISRKINKKVYTIHIKDSYNILQNSLANICKTFNTEVKKSYFPHKFVNKNTLFYKGNKPDKKYYINDISKYIDDNVYNSENEKDYDNRGNININIYNQIPKQNWVVKDTVIKYLEKDLISLYQVIDKLNSKVYIYYHTHLTNCLTISSLSMEIFLRRFYKNNIIPLINKKSTYNNIKESYYGGITEVYIPYGKNLYYYDVNSLYPYSALNAMPGLNCIYEDNINKNISEIKDLFGFYYCKIETSNNYFGLLPFRADNGLIMPLGNFEGWYFSEELKFASEQGYKINILSGYTFEKSLGVFDEYIKHMFHIKSTTKDMVEKTMVKSLLNNLLGRFGLDINKYETKVVPREQLNEFLTTRYIKSIRYIEDEILVTYDSEISKDICEQHGEDFNEKFIENIGCNESLKNDKFNNVSVAISSAVTAYSRIFMNKVKLDILNKGGKIYYTDTDSIVTDIKLDENLVGVGLGQFKLEHEIMEGYFISNKTYVIKTNKGKIVKRSKGHYSKNLSYTDYINLYKGNEVSTKKYESKRDFTKGVSLFKSKSMVLSPASYTKRIKIYNKKSWVDTKPLYISKYHTYSKQKKNNVGYILAILLTGLLVCLLLLLIYIYVLELDVSIFYSDFEKGNLPEYNPDNNNNNNIINNHNNFQIKEGSIKNNLDKYLSKSDSNLIKKRDFLQKSTISEQCKFNSYQNRSDILNEVKEIHLQEANQEIDRLNRENSLLNYSLIKHKIEYLDNLNQIDSIFKK